MRDDIDRCLVSRIPEAQAVYRTLKKFLFITTRADDDTNYDDMEQLWVDNLRDMVSAVKVNTETLYHKLRLSDHHKNILLRGAEYMNQKIASSAHKWRDLYSNGAYHRNHNVTLVSVARDQWPDQRECHAIVDFLERVADIVDGIKCIRAFGDIEFNLSVGIFGTLVSQLCTDRSDADLVLMGIYETNNTGGWGLIDHMSRGDSITLLKSIAGHFASKGCYKVQCIHSATIPVLKIHDVKTGNDCDLCFPSKEINLQKDHVFLALNLLDERFRILFTLVKLWAEHNGLCDASLGRLNTYTLVQLVVFHLQTRPKPVLPALRYMMPGEKNGRFMTGNRFRSPSGRIEAIAAYRLRCRAYKKLLANDDNHEVTPPGHPRVKHKNQENISELFNSFMVLLDGLFEGWNTHKKKSEGIPITQITRYLRVSTYYGCIYYGEIPSDIFEAGEFDSTHANQPGVIFVEDPFYAHENTARALSRSCCSAVAQATKFALKSYNKYNSHEYVARVFGCRSDV